MDVSVLKRFCELKVQHKKLEEELESLRRQIIAEFPEDTEVYLDDYTFKIVYQEKKY